MSKFPESQILIKAFDIGLLFHDKKYIYIYYENTSNSYDVIFSKYVHLSIIYEIIILICITYSQILYTKYLLELIFFVIYEPWRQANFFISDEIKFIFFCFKRIWRVSEGSTWCKSTLKFGNSTNSNTRVIKSRHVYLLETLQQNW